MLSKSRIISHRQCPKRLWLQVNRPELAQVDESSKLRMEDGNRVGDLARQLHPGGQLIDTLDREQALKETAIAMVGKKRPVFEPAFLAKNVLVRVDLLLPDEEGDQFRAVEVKSSTSVKSYHREDLAIQTWVMRQAGLALSKVAVAHIDTKFVYPGNLDYNGLLDEVELTSEVEKMLPEVAKWVQEANATLEKETAPDIAPGTQCTDPFPCPFMEHCQPVTENATEFPVEILPRGAIEATHLRAAGYKDLREVPSSLITNELHAKVHRVTVSGKAELDPEAKQILDALPWPRYYLDFETVAVPIPLYAGTRPYEAIPFQWSCHIEQEDGSMTHAEYLAEDGNDPRREFADSLIEVLGEIGTIIVYNQSFEKNKILALARLIPDLSDQLEGITKRLFDLLPVARNHYYHADMRGKWSIKSILPTIAPDLAYANLQVGHGMAAQDSFREMNDPQTTAEKRQMLRSALLEYCKLDTLAMVMVVKAFSAMGNR